MTSFDMDLADRLADGWYASNENLRKPWLSAAYRHRLHLIEDKGETALASPHMMAGLLADNGLADEPADSPLLPMLTLDALQANDGGNAEEQPFVPLMTWVVGAAMKAYGTCMDGTGDAYMPALLAYAGNAALDRGSQYGSKAAGTRYETKKRLAVRIASLDEDGMRRMLPRKDMLAAIPSNKTDAPSVIIERREGMEIRKDFMFPLQYVQESLPCNDNIVFRLGYERCLKITRTMLGFPLRSYGMTRRKTILTASELDDRGFDWMMSFMSALADIEHKPSIKGGITADYVNGHVDYPVEFALESETTNGDHIPSEYEDAALDAVRRIAAHNPTLAYNLSRTLFRVNAKADDMNIDKAFQSHIAILYYDWKSCFNPLMTRDIFTIIDRLNDADERIFDAFPSFTGDRQLFFYPFEGFNLLQMQESSPISGMLSARNLIDNAKTILHDDRTLFRWAMITCMFRLFVNLGLAESLFHWHECADSLHIETERSGGKRSRITMSKELRAYMKGGKIGNKMTQRCDRGSFTVHIPKFIVGTMNAMPASVDGLPEGMTGYDYFMNTLHDNAIRHNDEMAIYDEAIIDGDESRFF